MTRGAGGPRSQYTEDHEKRQGMYKVVANSRYHVEIDGIEHAAFSEVSGLQIEIVTEEIIEGGTNNCVYTLPVRAKVGRITLKRGITVGHELLKWQLQVVHGLLLPRNVTIVVYQTNGTELGRYSLTGAYPVKWSAPQLASAGEVVAVETLELAHSGTITFSSK